MVLSRTLSTTTQEFWTETAATLTGGTSIAHTTLLTRDINNIRKPVIKVVLHTVTLVPVITCAVTYDGLGRMIVTLTNTAAAGTSAGYTLDIQWVAIVNYGNADPSFTYSTLAAIAAPPVARLYVDGTLGDDNNDGLSFTTAWKTLDYLRKQLELQKALFPGIATTYVHTRGAWAADDHLAFTSLQQGLGRVVIGCDFDNSTVLQTGTVNAVSDHIGANPAPLHDLVFLTLTGITLTSADEGRCIRFINAAGTAYATGQIMQRVAAGTCWVSFRFGAGGVNPERPAFVVGGDTITAQIFESAAVVAGRIILGVEGRIPQAATGVISGQSVSLLNLRTYTQALIYGTGGGVVWIDARNAAGTAQPIVAVGGAGMCLGTWTSDWTHPDDMQEFGFADSTNANYAVGCRGSNVTATEGVFSVHGMFTGTVSLAATATALGVRAQSVQAAGSGASSASSCMADAGTTTTAPPYRATSGGMLATDRCCVITGNAAGLATGLWVVLDGGRLKVTNCSGLNYGTGVGLFGLYAERKGTFEIDGVSLAAIDGKNGRLRMLGTDGEISDAATIPSSFGAGADIFVQDGVLCLNMDVVKGAVNSATAIQNGVDGQIVAVGTQFISATAVFTAAHVGRSIKIAGAVNPANNDVHEITAYTDPNTVVLGAAVGLVNEGPGLTWGLVGTGNTFIELSRGGHIVQSNGMNLSIKEPEVNPVTTFQDWDDYGYGALGAIHMHEDTSMTLGTLVEPAGAANATGLAATILNHSTLLHTGGAVLLGVAPLQLGGNAAAAWPAASTSDLAAGVPQFCFILPAV